MTWRCYLAIFRAESPVHIGYRQIGVLKTTRYYITGRVMWGAITANLTRALFSNPNSGDYQAVGKFVRENIRTTYFYPAIKKSEAASENWSQYEVNNYIVFLPEYTDEGEIKFGEVLKENFEQMFISSFVSTALEAQTRTAEEGSLHEFEYVQNKINLSHKVIQVYWVGYLFVNDTVKDAEEGKVYEVNILEESNDLKIVFKKNNIKNYAFLKKDALNLLFIGGESNYGFGKIRLETLVRSSEGTRLFGKFKFETETDGPVIEVDTAPAHLSLESIKSEEKLLGEVEPVVGLEWSDKGAGHSISTAIICITPGSKIFRRRKYILGKYGILRSKCSNSRER